MAHHVYILHSVRLDRFYTGNTDLNPNDRLEEHNSKIRTHSFTAKGIPRSLFLSFDYDSRLQARLIKSHIKKMKSKTYIHNLK